MRPAGPSALNFITQSRTICSVTPPILAAAVRVALALAGILLSHDPQELV
jgi:hypothetical protein